MNLTSSGQQWSTLEQIGTVRSKKVEPVNDRILDADDYFRRIYDRHERKNQKLGSCLS